MIGSGALQYRRVKARTHKKDSDAILYDADAMPQPDPDWFDAAFWRKRGAVSGEAVGRGSAWFLDTEFGPAVLRRYLRGGQVARVSRDRYFFNGFERSRPFHEFRVTAELLQQGLPVPHPLAALCRREGAFYTGALLTARLTGAEPLADRLGREAPDSGTWGRVGKTVKRFHESGVFHADLNARNILVEADRVFLIDFDRARMGAIRVAAAERNMQRLRRSLSKLWPEGSEHSLADCWRALMDGYSA
jgi:3-deoxy-D-manno-octulosonic acid kinase